MSPANIFPDRPPMPDGYQMEKALEACLIIQQRAVDMGKQPFAAVLLGPDNETVLLTHSNLDHVNHAESSLVRLAAAHYTQEYLWTCTLYTTWEPCAMCTATAYWANIGRIVYAASEERLAELTGQGNEKNMTMSISCRKVLEGSQKNIDIIGPVASMEDRVVLESDVYWRPLREAEEKRKA
ncbi:hypothetical protein LTR36_006269 [Oleoguttula mirabilis]|uniref:CMP/dCMP-type deaminase domain-containing protein n=1 Tax=Oleoguttula mirabilis TaxID=1507867 RepID=A0AAV9JCL1_9PEZI|nr:hypothetical protein LTR36_006269 [Oleoguttula mirabilis]